MSRLWDKGSSVDSLVLSFTVGNDYLLDSEIMPYDCLGSAAHARMLCKEGFLSSEELSGLLSELKRLYKKSLDGSYSIPVEFEDCHTAIESELTKKCGDAGKKIHNGRSRNDQVLTAIRLLLRDRAICQCELLLELYEAFSKRFQKDGSLPMPGYTHLQPAMPSSVGMWLQSFSAHILSLVKEGLSFLEGSDLSPLGAASGFGVPFSLNRELTASLLGFSQVQDNPIDVQNSRGRFERRYLSWNTEIGMMLEKFAWDGVLYSSKEFSFIKLPVAFTTGSSIMPQKRNPDVLELLRARGSRQKAHMFELDSVTSKLPSNYFRDYQLAKEPVLRSSQDINQCLNIMCRLLPEIEFQEEKLKAAMGEELYATYEVYRLVQDGDSFRDAYKTVGVECQKENPAFPKAKEGFSFIEKQLEGASSKLDKDAKSLQKELQTWSRRFSGLEQSLF